MKKTLALLLALVMVISLCACGGENSTAEDEEVEKQQTVQESDETQEVSTPPTKEELLSTAKPLTRDEIDKSINNAAFAKTLIGNTYTFVGDVFSVKEDYVAITFRIEDEQGIYGTAANVMAGNLYLPIDELISLENQQRLSFVGTINDVKGINIEFANAYIVNDRFEETGVLDSPNTSYGDNSWNIKYPNSNYLGLVYFADDVSSYKGSEITYSYKIINGKSVDAYIVE